MEVDEKVDFIADILARCARHGPADGVAGSVVQGVLGLIQAEHVPLGVERDPVGRVHVEVEVEVVNVLTTDKIEEAEVVMAKGKQELLSNLVF